MERSLICKIEVPLYPTHIELSKKRRAKYYVKGKGKKKIPKKYANLKFNKKGILVHKDGTPVIANPKSVGTPNLKKINGQEIYSGMPAYTRAKIVDSLKKYFKKCIKGTDPIEEFPVQLEMELHDEIGAGNWDLDNLWIYNKCFQDALVDSGILPDDHIRYISKPAAPMFIPIPDTKYRKMVWRIYRDERDIILNNPYYQENVLEEQF